MILAKKRHIWLEQFNLLDDLHLAPIQMWHGFTRVFIKLTKSTFINRPHKEKNKTVRQLSQEMWQFWFLFVRLSAILSCPGNLKLLPPGLSRTITNTIAIWVEFEWINLVMWEIERGIHAIGGFLITITAILPKTQLKTSSHEIHEETNPINQLLSLAYLY